LPDELVSKAKQSRSEKKARKAMSKLGETYCILTSLSACKVITQMLYNVHVNCKGSYQYNV